MKKETLKDNIEYKNEIYPDFIGDNSKTMKEGTITSIGYIKEQKVKQFIKDLDNFIEDKTLIKKGFPNRIVFLEFEWKGFLKENAGFEDLE